VGLQAADPGFDPRGVLTARVTLPPDAEDHTARVLFFSNALDRVRALPGVAVAGAISDLPLAATANQSPVFRHAGDQQGVLCDSLIATPGALEALGVEWLEGRGFARTDDAGAAPVAIVDRKLAERLWPGESPLERQLQFGEKGRRVVGVVRQPRQYALEADDRPQLYLPHAQHPTRSLALVVKASATAGLTEAVRRSVWQVDPERPLYDEALMERRVAGALAGRRFALAVLGGFAAAAVLLAALGLYGLMAFSVGMREREFGLRLALGARGRDLVGLVLGECWRIAVLGVLLGVGASALGARALRSLVWGVAAWDPATLAAVAGLLSVVALSAGLLPALRASGLDPLAALRDE
jgi:predicted permease